MLFCVVCSKSAVKGLQTMKDFFPNGQCVKHSVEQILDIVLLRNDAMSNACFHEIYY